MRESLLYPATAVVVCLVVASSSLAVILFGPNTPGYNQSNPQQTNQEPMDILFEVVEQGYYCGIVNRSTHLITSLDAWQALWLEMCRRYEPIPEAPVVDFETKMILAVFLGEFSTGGYYVSISSIVLTDGVYEVCVNEYHPGEGCGVTMALSQPYEIVTLPKPEQEFSMVFTYTTHVVQCVP